jgi:hypothetical protein
MFGSNKSHAVGEHEAGDEIDAVYHEIRQVLRVSGVNLNFRAWAGFGRSFPLVWDAVRENAGTYAFERAADELRASAVRGSLTLPAVRAIAEVPLGPSQLYQMGAALALYHYINPKLLLITAAVRLALDGVVIPGSPSADTRRIPRGVPPRMYPMEMVDEDIDDPLVQQTFEDIRQTLSLSAVNSDYRTLALWPEYLSAAWTRLKPIVITREFDTLAIALQDQAEALARALPYRVKLTRLDIATTGDDDNDFMKTTARFEQILPPLILIIALLALDGASADVCMESPFPVAEPAPEGALA